MPHACSVTQSCPTLCTPGTVAHQAPLSMGYSRQGYWSGLTFPSPGGSSWARDWTHISCIGRWILYGWAPGKQVVLILSKALSSKFTASTPWESISQDFFLLPICHDSRALCLPGPLPRDSLEFHAQLPGEASAAPHVTPAPPRGWKLFLTCLSLGTGSTAHTHLQLQLSGGPSADNKHREMIASEALTLQDTQGKLTRREKQRQLWFPSSYLLFYHSVDRTKAYNAFPSKATKFHNSKAL